MDPRTANMLVTGSWDKCRTTCSWLAIHQPPFSSLRRDASQRPGWTLQAIDCAELPSRDARSRLSLPVVVGECAPRPFNRSRSSPTELTALLTAAIKGHKGAASSSSAHRQLAESAFPPHDGLHDGKQAGRALDWRKALAKASRWTSLVAARALLPTLASDLRLGHGGDGPPSRIPHECRSQAIPFVCQNGRPCLSNRGMDAAWSQPRSRPLAPSFHPH